MQQQAFSHEEVLMLNKIRADLNKVYDLIPATKGCMEHINEPVEAGGCGAWCCLTPETLVFTAFGPMPIKSVKAGINVMTKNGWRRVVRTGSRHVAEDITRLRTCYGREMMLTSNHEVYVDMVERKERYSAPNTPTFVPAGQLVPKAGQNSNQPGHYVVFPKNRWVPDRPAWVLLELAEYIDDLFIVTVPADAGETVDVAYASKRMKGSSLPATIVADPAFVRIVGLFLAEGSFGDSQIEFHLNSDEVSLREEVYAFARRLGLRASHRVTRGKSLTVRVFSRLLKRLFVALCGDGCDKKKLDPHFLDALTTSRELTQALHDGCYAGDGARSGDNGGDYSFTTTSPDLAGQMVHINHLLNRMVGVYRHDPAMKRTSWTLSDNRDVKYKDYVETEADFRVPVRSVESIWYEGLVYDIEVEGEHSFFTEAGEVHNCQVQNPQVLYVEYLNMWRHVNQDWDAESFLSLIVAAIRNYLQNTPTKGCIFWDARTKMCTQHTTRPLACRTYGIMPEDEWKPRYERLKIVYPTGDFRPQCGLVSTENGKQVIRRDTDRWWRMAVDVEKSIGIPSSKITDAKTGTYRTYHDHIIMNLFGQNKKVLVELTRLRVNGTPEEKEKFVRTVIAEYRKRATGTQTVEASAQPEAVANAAKPDVGPIGPAQSSEQPNTDGTNQKS